MSFDQLALQAALYVRLKAEIPDVPIFANVPQEQPYPYVRIGPIVVGDASAKDVGFVDCQITVSVFFRDATTTENVLGTMKRVSDALHRRAADLNALMAGQAAVTLNREFAQLVEQGEADGNYQNGVQRFRTLIQETA